MDYKRIERDNQRAFNKMFSVCGDRKCRLVLQPENKNMISRIVSGETLSEHFDKIHIYEDNFPFISLQYAMIVPPEIPLIKKILRNVDAMKEKNGEPTIQFWFQPHITDTVAAFLIDTDNAPVSLLKTFPDEEHNALDAGRKPRSNIEVYNLGIEIFPLDRDCFTMNDKYSFLKGWVFRDLTITSDFRIAIDKVVAKLGTFASITCVGGLSKAVGLTLPPPNKDASTHIILLDRSVDLITPCITQMNYEGLIAEFLGIDCGIAMIGNEKTNKHQLLSTVRDQLFALLANKNHKEASQIINERMNTVTGTLHNKVTNFGDTLEDFNKKSRVSLENKTIVDHINLAELLYQKMSENKWFKAAMNAEADALSGNSTIHELISEMLEEGADLRQEIRLLSLETLLKGGIQDFQKIIQSIAFNHGVQQIPYLMRLCECGLLDKPLIKWNNFIKQFKLYVPEWEEEGDEAAAAYYGYAPLSIRVIQSIINNDFNTIRKNLGGGMFDMDQRGEIDPEGEYLVCFIGGCTHSELNTLRRLAPEQVDENGEVEDKKKHLSFKVLTTNMFTSNEFFENIGFCIPGWKPQ